MKKQPFDGASAIKCVICWHFPSRQNTVISPKGIASANSFTNLSLALNSVKAPPAGGAGYKLLRSPRRGSHLTLLEFDCVVCLFQSNYGVSDVNLTLFCIGSSLRPAFPTFCTSENARPEYHSYCASGLSGMDRSRRSKTRRCEWYSEDAMRVFDFRQQNV